MYILQRFGHVKRMYIITSKIIWQAERLRGVFTTRRYTNARREAVVIKRLEIGNSRFTHSYLLSGEDQPTCTSPDGSLTVTHILLDCSDSQDIRQKYFKGQIPLGPVLRNFLVANVTMKLRASYRLITRKSGVSGVSPACYEEVTRNWSQWNLALTLLVWKTSLKASTIKTLLILLMMLILYHQLLYLLLIFYYN